MMMLAKIETTLAEEIILAPAYLKYLIATIIFTVATVGLSANGILFVAFFRRPKLRKRYCFVLHLAVCHMIAAFLYIVIAIKTVHDFRMHEGGFFCELDGFGLGCTALAAIWLLLFIVGEQLIAVKWPFFLPQLSLRVKNLMAASTYPLACVLHVPPFLGWGERVQPHGYGWWCCFNFYESDWGNRSYFLLLYFYAFFLPMGLILTSYALIFKSAQKWEGGNGTFSSGRVSDGASRSKKKLFLTSIGVVAGFFLSWGPFATVAWVAQFYSELEIPLIAIEICAIMAKLFILWSPVIFYLFNDRFRKELKRPPGFNYALASSYQHMTNVAIRHQEPNSTALTSQEASPTPPFVSKLDNSANLVTWHQEEFL